MVVTATLTASDPHGRPVVAGRTTPSTGAAVARADGEVCGWPGHEEAEMTIAWRWWTGSDTSRRRSKAPARGLSLEGLEPRLALSAAPANVPTWLSAAPATAVGVQNAASLSPANLPQGSPGPKGFTPAQIRHAYGLDTVSFGAVPADGAGTTIAIVTAYDSPNIAADLATFDATFGLPAPPSFKTVNQSGGAKLPAMDPAWATETCIDVQWAHAIAPGASILVVEANGNSDADLMAAVSFARSAPGVVAVSMSWGRGEYAGETGFDARFSTPAGHPGVTFLAASGDDGAPGIYPAMSPNVVAVGGTSLTLSKSGTAQEKAWSGSGGGQSQQESRPSWQAGVVPATLTKRAIPDVSLVADPATGLAVCDSRAGGAARPWSVYGGTSIATPQWAGIAAIVAQGRALRGAASLDGATQFLPALYALAAADFRDVTVGTTLGAPGYAAGAGFDLATGRGSPVAGTLVKDLVAWESKTPAPPAAPASFTAKATSSSEVALSWKASAGADGYRLYEVSGTTLTLVASYSAGTTSASVTGLAPRSTHTWRLDAWNGAGAASSTVSATLPAGIVAPTGLAVKVLSRDTVQVTWNPVAGATSYSVFSLEGITLTRVGGTTGRLTTLKVSGLRPGSTLSFAVRAENGSQNATAGWVKVTLPG